MQKVEEYMEIQKFRDFREHVPGACKRAYFDTATTGLIPDFVYEAVSRYQRDRYLEVGDTCWYYADGSRLGTLDMMERTKGALAEMIGSRKENIVFGQNSSQMYTLLTGGLVFEPGDNVVLPEDGWMANRFAWQIRQQDGLKLRYVTPKDGMILAEDVIAACDSRTRAIAMPLVEPSTGYLIDAERLGRFCREKDIFFAVDGVQALGVLPVDVEKMGIDFLVGNDYKWMMNFCGTGYAYISPKLQKALKQTAAGWLSDDERFNTEKETLRLREDAGRFELGFPTVSGIYGVGLVAEQYNALGREDIESYVRSLSEQLCRRAKFLQGIKLAYDFPLENRSSIMILQIDPKLGITDKVFADAGIYAPISVAEDGVHQRLRLCFHYYNNVEDVERLCDALDVCKSQKENGFSSTIAVI